MDYKLIPYPAHDLELIWKREEKINFYDDGKAIILIGYRVVLTPHEYKIVKLLYDETAGISADNIIEKCFKHKDITHGNVAVHVYNINQKVLPITNRRLIIGDRKQGYKINENL